MLLKLKENKLHMSRKKFFLCLTEALYKNFIQNVYILVYQSNMYLPCVIINFSLGSLGSVEPVPYATMKTV